MEIFALLLRFPDDKFVPSGIFIAACCWVVINGDNDDDCSCSFCWFTLMGGIHIVDVGAIGCAVQVICGFDTCE